MRHLAFWLSQDMNSKRFRYLTTPPSERRSVWELFPWIRNQRSNFWFDWAKKSFELLWRFCFRGEIVNEYCYPALYIQCYKDDCQSSTWHLVSSMKKWVFLKKSRRGSLRKTWAAGIPWSEVRIFVLSRALILVFTALPDSPIPRPRVS